MQGRLCFRCISRKWAQNCVFSSVVLSFKSLCLLVRDIFFLMSGYNHTYLWIFCTYMKRDYARFGLGYLWFSEVEVIGSPPKPMNPLGLDFWIGLKSVVASLLLSRMYVQLESHWLLWSYAVHYFSLMLSCQASGFCGSLALWLDKIVGWKQVTFS